ncbi:MAG: hypothetical protein SCH66_05665 [Methanolobus sp.]|nr:hypothetical protein [Methanolobus sp.]
MKNRSLKYVILFFLCILVSGCTGINDGNSFKESLNDSEGLVKEPIDHSAANLTLSLMPTELSVKEISNLQLSLKNEGNFTVNIAKFEEHVTYNIIYSNGSDIEYSELPSIDAMSDGSLVELKPNESLSINISSRSWQPFSKGEHPLSAKYFTGWNVFTKPHWNGVLRSNNITLIVE